MNNRSRTTLLGLPDELLIHIFSYVTDTKTLLVAVRVCKAIQGIGEPLLYRSSLLKDYQQDKDPKNSFLTEAHKVQSKYLGSKHPTFKFQYRQIPYILEIRKRLRNGFLRKYGSIVDGPIFQRHNLGNELLKQLCKVDPAFAIIAIVRFGRAPCAAKTSGERLYTLFNVALLTSQGAMYTVQDDDTRALYLNNEFFPASYTFPILVKSFCNVGLYILKNIRTLYEHPVLENPPKETFEPIPISEDFSKKELCSMLCAIASAFQETVSFTLQDPLLFNLLKNEEGAIFKLILNYPDICKRALDEVELNAKLQPLKGADQFFPKIEAIVRHNGA